MVDPTFSFMTVDHDGKIRMDCSSPYAMANLVRLKDSLPRRLRQRSRLRPARHRHAHGRADEPQPLPGRRHPLPAPHRPSGRRRPRVGKTLVSSSMIDRVVAHAWAGSWSRCRSGFKWFVAGLFDGTLGFGGEESAGASFLRRDGTVWTTDKDGLILGPAGRRDHGPDRQGPGPALPGADGALRHAALHAHRRSRPRREQKAC